jgi:hypothetical protein
MSTFREKITLTNTGDQTIASRGLMPDSDVRSLTVDACVDTGAWYLVINEEIRATLGLGIAGTKTAELADGCVREYAITEPVEFRWKDRREAMGAMVVPGATVVLFGSLCMEALDLIADPVDECLRGRHGAKPVHALVSVRKPTA